MKIVLATRNKGKIRDFNSLLKGLPFEFVGLDRFPSVSDVEETGNSFAENARSKASGYARNCGLHAIADDSGLEVAALGGRPGVFSARYADVDTGYDVKIARLLEELELSNSLDRTARFVACVAFATPDGETIFEVEGVCGGTIAAEARGANGFGYDPIFIPSGFENTFGELSHEVKNEIGHRAAATRKIMRYLRDLA